MVLPVAVLTAGCMGGPVVDDIVYIDERVVEGTGYTWRELVEPDRRSIPRTADLDPSGQRVAISFDDGSIEVWDRNGTLIGALRDAPVACEFGYQNARFSANGTLLAGCGPRLVALAINGHQLWELEVGDPGHWFEDIAVASSAPILAYRFPQPVVHVLNWETGRNVSFGINDVASRQLAISANGEFVASSGGPARFVRVDLANNTTNVLHEETHRLDTYVCEDGLEGLVGRTIRKIQGSAKAVSLDGSESTTPLVANATGDDSRMAGAYQGELVFSSPDCRWVGWVNSLGARSSPPDQISVERSVAVIIVLDRQHPEAQLGFAAGPVAVWPNPPSSGTGTPGATWVVSVFLFNDGSGLAVSADRSSPGGGPANVWLTEASAGAVWPSVATSAF